MQQLFLFGLVFFGGGVGSICRYGLNLMIQPWQPRFPWATLFANALACFILGLILGWQQQGILSDQRRLLLATGFCGGFSTFSTFSNETIQLVMHNRLADAFINLIVSVVLCFGATLLGMWLGK